MEGDANDECSSYGTHNSYEGDMEKVVDAPIDGVVETLRALKASNATMVASIASIVASQGTVVEKLNSLEKAVVTVQFEMTWVRDDMKGVHTIMEKHTENDTELRDPNAEVVRQLRHECDEGISTKPWKGKGQVEEGCEATPRSRPLAKRACTQEEPIGENDGTFADGGYIEETQNHSQYVERLTSIASSPEDENVSDWEPSTQRRLAKAHRAILKHRCDCRHMPQRRSRSNSPCHVQARSLEHLRQETKYGPISGMLCKSGHLQPQRGMDANMVG